MEVFNGISRKSLLLYACMEERRRIGKWLSSQLVFQTATREEIEKNFNKMIFLGKNIVFLRQKTKRKLTLDDLTNQTGKAFFERTFFKNKGFKGALSKDEKECAYFCENCGWVLGNPREEHLISGTISETDFYCNICNKIIGIKIIIFQFPI